MARFKLSLMLLLQYMMYAVWWVPLAAYLTNLEVGSAQKSLILSSMAIGCSVLVKSADVVKNCAALRPQELLASL